MAATLATTTLAVGGSLIGLTSPAFAVTPTSFTPGDLVVERVGTVGGATPSSTSAPVSLWDYSTAGTPSGYSVTFPSSTATDSPTSHALVDSGSATYNGAISLSADGQYVYVAGYDDNAGVVSLTSTVGVPRTVGIVSVGGSVDTSTALTANSSDSTPPNLTATGINFRTATGTTGGSSPFYSGGDDGLAISPDGATTATSLDADAIHQLELSDGQLYESTTTAIEQVGTGEPVSGSPTDTALIASPPSKFEPAGFAFATVGSATSPNVLYVADTKNNAVEKYVFNGTTWVEKGTVTVSGVTGLALSVSGSTVSLYVTNQADLYGITDGSGAAGTLSGTAGVLAAAPTGESMKGVVLLPASPGTGTPETPFVVLLPGVAALGLAGFVVVRRRRSPRTA
jgi:MYXO-CTERM domain-containing protein